MLQRIASNSIRRGEETLRKDAGREACGPPLRLSSLAIPAKLTRRVDKNPLTTRLVGTHTYY